MKFKVGDIVKDKDGDDIRIVCVDNEGDLPIVGVCYGSVYQYSASGIGDNTEDLVVPKKPKVNYLAYEKIDGALMWVIQSDLEKHRILLKRVPSLDIECEVDE